MMTPWYAYGETGEAVLSVVESALDGGDQTRFINSLRKIGLSDQEIMHVYAEEVLGIEQKK
tara:strand:+ start:142 stop:324 length:183 start_codon:yes stop_codon:yes gene_type:complete